VQRVFRGYTRLTNSQQNEVVELINDFSRRVTEQKTAVRKSFENVPGVVLGPVGSGCPCCGR